MTSEEYAQILDDFELDKKIGLIPEDFDLTSYIEQRRREFESKADGGSIGIEVLFTDKKPRQKLFMGGPALEGQPLAIYNSMSAYGFSDQEIANAIKEAGYELPTAESTQPETGIINQQLTPQRDDRVIGLQETFTKDLSGDPRFNYLEPTAQANKYRFDRSVEPREGLLGFFDSAMNKMKESSFFQPKVRGTLGTRLANQKMLPIPVPSMITAQMRSPFNPDSPTYNPLLEGQLNFLEGLDNMIGRDAQSGLLKYGSGSVLRGQNVISGFGSNNYLRQLNKYINRRNITNKARQRGIDERNKFLAAEEARLAAEEARKAKIAKEKQMADVAERARLERLGRDKDRGGFDPSGPTQASIRASREDRSGATGTRAGGFTNPGRGSYGPFMADGGLATMFTRRR